MAMVSQWVAVAAGMWLIGLGGLMALWPRRALAVLARMGGSNTVHFGEMALRTLIGIALVIAGPASRFPVAIPIIGWFLIVSALVLAVLPRRSHAAYSVWWSQHIPVPAVRLVSPLSVAGGAALIWTMT